MIDTVLIVIAAICFAIAAFGLLPGKVNWLALGLLAWVLTNLL